MRILKLFSIFISVMVVFLIFIDNYPDLFKRKYESMSYNSLPKAVRKSFDSIYNKRYDGIPKNEFFSLNKGEKCFVKKLGLRFHLTREYELYTNRDRRTKISSLYFQKVFIIKGDTLFFPDSYKKYGTLTGDKPRSYNIKIDTIMFNYEIIPPKNR